MVLVVIRMSMLSISEGAYISVPRQMQFSSQTFSPHYLHPLSFIFIFFCLMAVISCEEFISQSSRGYSGVDSHIYQLYYRCKYFYLYSYSFLYLYPSSSFYPLFCSYSCFDCYSFCGLPIIRYSDNIRLTAIIIQYSGYLYYWYSLWYSWYLASYYHQMIRSCIKCKDRHIEAGQVYRWVYQGYFYLFLSICQDQNSFPHQSNIYNFLEHSCPIFITVDYYPLVYFFIFIHSYSICFDFSPSLLISIPNHSITHPHQPIYFISIPVILFLIIASLHSYALNYAVVSIYYLLVVGYLFGSSSYFLLTR